MNLEFTETPEFKKDFKALLKRYRTLEDDFATMKKFVLVPLYEKGIQNSGVVPIESFCGNGFVSNKIRKFSCKSLKGRGSASGIRVIYVWEEVCRKITFVQIYIKSDFENEDKKRLRRFLDKALAESRGGGSQTNPDF